MGQGFLGPNSHEPHSLTDITQVLQAIFEPTFCESSFSLDQIRIPGKGSKGKSDAMDNLQICSEYRLSETF